MRLLSNLSSAYALYEVVDGDLLRPMTVRRLDRFDDDLLTIQKYPGKTNEQFTKLLLNVTLWSSRFGAQMLDRKLLVTDPLCGRGTTLNQALTYGYDASGIDIDTRDFDAYSTFMQTYVKRKRLKHQAAVVRVKRDGRVTGRRFDLTLAESKDRYRAGDTVTLSVINADTTSALEFLPRGRSDVLVTDAPYGVQHASRTSHRGAARSPLELLTAALPTWVDLLRSGGALGVAWNVHVARREDAAAVLTDAGLRVCDEGPYREFGHRVDQAITPGHHRRRQALTGPGTSPAAASAELASRRRAAGPSPRAIRNPPAAISTIMVPLGTLAKYEAYMPSPPQIEPMIVDSTSIRWKDCVSRRAVTAGMTSIAATSVTPMTVRVARIARLRMLTKIASVRATLTPEACATSGSNVANSSAR